MSHADAVDNRYSMGIANFVSNFELSNVPNEVKHRAKLLFLDSIGCGLYGARLMDTEVNCCPPKVDHTKSCSV